MSTRSEHTRGGALREALVTRLQAHPLKGAFDEEVTEGAVDDAMDQKDKPTEPDHLYAEIGLSFADDDDNPFFKNESARRAEALRKK